MARAASRWLQWLSELFSKTRIVECGDGRRIRVHKKVEDAFPFFARNRGLGLKATSDGLGSLGLELGLRSEVQAILANMDSESQSLLTEIAGLYSFYQSNPCLHEQYYAQSVQDLVARHRRLAEARTLLETLPGLVKNGATTEECQALFERAVVALNDPQPLLVSREVRSMLDTATESLQPAPADQPPTTGPEV